jgi:V/A-type H+-transporting ATPase subunit K
MSKKNLSMLLFSSFLIYAVMLLFPDLLFAVASDVVETNTGKGQTGVGYMAAALAVGIACIASSYAVARIGSAGLGAMSEKPELSGRALIFLGLAEGIAIYGLIIAIMILNML